MAGLLRLFMPQLRGLLGERAVARVLKRHSDDVANDIILPNGGGGLTQIDHLVLTASAILVIETKHYSGLILGRAHEPQWTQVLGRRRYGFQNPLRQNHGHIKAVQALIPHLRVEGRVVFVGGARFPKGRPPGVYDLASLERELAGLRHQTIPRPLELGWSDLLAQVRQDRKARHEHLASVKARRHGAGPVAARPPPTRLTSALREHAGLRIALAVLLPLALFGLLVQGLTNLSLQSRAPWRVERAGTPSLTLATPARPPDFRADAGPHTGRIRSDPQIRWSPTSERSAAQRQCREAQAAVLIENTASNRWRREHACAAFAAGMMGSRSTDAQASAPAAVVAGPWKRLHSAGELTPN